MTEQCTGPAVARKRVTPWRRLAEHLLLGFLVAAMLVAAGAAQILRASASPERVASAAASIPTPAARGDVVSSAAVGDVGAQTLELYGGQMRPLVTESDGVQTLNIYGPGGQIIAQVVQDAQGSQQVRHLLADRLGSTRAVVDAAGTAVARYEYAPYGETTVAGAHGAEVSYRFTGHPYDHAQEIYQTPARGYEPVAGRFLSVDPQREGGSPYVYAENNPVAYVDPTGGVFKVPYFMQTGFERTYRKRSSLANSIAKVFGPDLHTDVATSDIFKTMTGMDKSYAETHAEWLLTGDGNRDYSFNDTFFWFVGEDRPEGKPDRSKPGLEAMRVSKPDYAEKVVLIDFTKTDESQVIRAEIDARGKPYVFIEAEIERGTNTHGNPKSVGFKVKGRPYTREGFRDYVKNEMGLKWPEAGSTASTAPTNGTPVTAPEPRIDMTAPTVPTAGQKHPLDPSGGSVELAPKRPGNVRYELWKENWVPNPSPDLPAWDSVGY